MRRDGPRVGGTARTSTILRPHSDLLTGCAARGPSAQHFRIAYVLTQAVTFFSLTSGQPFRAIRGPDRASTQVQARELTGKRDEEESSVMVTSVLMLVFLYKRGSQPGSDADGDTPPAPRCCCWQSRRSNKRRVFPIVLCCVFLDQSSRWLK